MVGKEGRKDQTKDQALKIAFVATVKIHKLENIVHNKAS
jgi:hypothetical protein